MNSPQNPDKKYQHGLKLRRSLGGEKIMPKGENYREYLVVKDRKDQLTSLEL